MCIRDRLETKENDSNFLDLFASAKLSGKRKLAGYIHRQTGVLVDPSSLFDVQVKRIHQYKRQHLNALQVIAQYLRIKNGITISKLFRKISFIFLTCV